MSPMIAESVLLSVGSSTPMPQQTKERTKGHEFQFVTEANLTPRDIARFSHAGRQRPSGTLLSCDIAPRLRGGLRGTNPFAGRTAREDARQVQCRSPQDARAR